MATVSVVLTAANCKELSGLVERQNLYKNLTRGIGRFFQFVTAKRVEWVEWNIQNLYFGKEKQLIPCGKVVSNTHFHSFIYSNLFFVNIARNDQKGYLWILKDIQNKLCNFKESLELCPLRRPRSWDDLHIGSFSTISPMITHFCRIKEAYTMSISCADFTDQWWN